MREAHLVARRFLSRHRADAEKMIREPRAIGGNGGKGEQQDEDGPEKEAHDEMDVAKRQFGVR